ncbi:helix-turn-helix transcriptional regulator [Mycoplasmatota bacterium]|nr:helix-turn-helix transcriptional regulator [Mycoplasmatota bacterium]
MEFKIGEVIRNLRKEKKLTQEKLAEYLGVSFQTISKWENGIVYPDITNLPSIANFFNISIDKLFYQDKSENEIVIDKIYDECCWSNKESAELILRETLQKYPGNFKLMQALLSVLYKRGNVNNSDEIINLGNRILDDCTDDKLRWFTMQDMIFLYKKLDRKDKAIELIDKFPSMTNEDLLFHVCSNNKKDFYAEALKERTVLRLNSIYSYYYKKYKDTNYEESFIHIDSFLNMYKLLYPNQTVHLDLVIVFLLRKAELKIKIADYSGSVKCIMSAYNLVNKAKLETIEKERLENIIKSNLIKSNFDEVKSNKEILLMLNKIRFK